MVIVILDLVSSCDTNDQGDAVFRRVSKAISGKSKVVLDFSGVPNVTTSFVNSSFVALADKFGVGAVKSLVQVQGLNRQIANMLKDRLSRQAA